MSGKKLPSRRNLRKFWTTEEKVLEWKLDLANCKINSNATSNCNSKRKENNLEGGKKYVKLIWGGGVGGRAIIKEFSKKGIVSAVISVTLSGTWKFKLHRTLQVCCLATLVAKATEASANFPYLLMDAVTGIQKSRSWTDLMAPEKKRFKP